MGPLFQPTSCWWWVFISFLLTCQWSHFKILFRRNDRDPFFRKNFREYIKMAIGETTTHSLLKSAWMIEDARLGVLRASKRSLYWADLIVSPASSEHSQGWLAMRFFFFSTPWYIWMADFLLTDSGWLKSSETAPNSRALFVFTPDVMLTNAYHHSEAILQPNNAF